MRLKVCGATRVSDVAALARAGADFVGLWHGVPSGHAELDLPALTRLATAAATTNRIRPVLITLESTVDSVARAVVQSHVRWVQLHGYQPPGMVRALKGACPELTVIKALHVRAGTCVERTLIGAYERAGVDVFLLDTLTLEGKIGSTAQPIDPLVATALADLSSLPVMLAGGLTTGTAARYRRMAGHRRLFGIDVDSGARGRDGWIDPDRVSAIRREWTVLEAS